jgi:hypothetical protein
MGISRWGSGEDEEWTCKVYAQIWAIYIKNPGDRYHGGGMDGKLENKEMETQWYQFQTAMGNLFCKFYRKVDPEYGYTLKAFDGQWQYKGISDPTLRVTVHIAVHEAYEKWLDFVWTVDAQADWALRKALDQLRGIYLEPGQKKRFAIFKQKQAMGLSEWEAAEAAGEAETEKKRERALAARRGYGSQNMCMGSSSTESKLEALRRLGAGGGWGEIEPTEARTWREWLSGEPDPGPAELAKLRLEAATLRHEAAEKTYENSLLKLEVATLKQEVGRLQGEVAGLEAQLSKDPAVMAARRRQAEKEDPELKAERLKREAEEVEEQRDLSAWVKEQDKQNGVVENHGGQSWG